MANIIVECRGYTGAFANLNGTFQLQVSRRSLLLASLTVGFERLGELWQSGWRDWTSRISDGFSSIVYLTSEGGNLSLHSNFALLDGSRKTTKSYWLGTILAKVVADRLLSIPWLADVDLMQKQGLLQNTVGTFERGDMVGRTRTGEWHVVEAKGRSTAMETGLVAKAKAQASRVTLVRNTVPSTSSACVACLWKKPITVILDDPPAGGSGEMEQWIFAESDFWNHYYGNMAAYLRIFGQADREGFLPGYLFAPVDGLPGRPPFFHSLPWMDRDLQIGLPIEIVNEPSTAPEVLRTLSRVDEDFVAKDGVAVIGPIKDWEQITGSS